MFSRKKEKKVKQLIAEHISAVEQTVTSMVETVEKYVDNDFKQAREKSYNTHNMESKADSIRRELIAIMYKGAFFPSIREDLINFIAKQDKIADRAESCCDFLITQRPDVPGNFSEDLVSLARASYETLMPLKQAVQNYFEDSEKARSSIRTVNAKEEEADTVEWHLTEKIFQSQDLSLARKIHLREFVYHIVTVSDITENAADMLEAVIIKRNI